MGKRFLPALLVMAVACKAQPANSISGKITLSGDWKPIVYLVQPRNFSEIAADYQGQVLDSAMISADGTFTFSAIPIEGESSLFELVVQKTNSRFANHLMDSLPAMSNYMPVILSKGKSVIVKADIHAFQKTLQFFQPAPENEILISLRDTRSVAFSKMSAATGEDLQEDSMLIEREKIFEQYVSTLIHFADTTTNLQAALLAIRWISPTNDFEREPEFIYRQCQKWSAVAPRHPFVSQLCVYGDQQHLPVMTGAVMPDYPMPMAEGDTLSLHKLLGDKITILDIWASWCAPCRRENRNVLAPLWRDYQAKGLQILGYSIDANGNAWKAAIRKDGANWRQASHLTGDDSPFMNALRISTIPANYILDADGKVVARNLYGEALNSYIRRQLN